MRKDHGLLACIQEIPSTVEFLTQWVRFPKGAFLEPIVEPHAWKEQAELFNQLVAAESAIERRRALHRIAIPEAGLPARFDFAGSLDQETTGENVIFRAGARAELVEEFVETQLAHTLDRKVGFFVFFAGEVGFEAEFVVGVLTHDEPLGGCRGFLSHRVFNERRRWRVGHR